MNPYQFEFEFNETNFKEFNLSNIEHYKRLTDEVTDFEILVILWFPYQLNLQTNCVGQQGKRSPGKQQHQCPGSSIGPKSHPYSPVHNK